MDTCTVSNESLCWDIWQIREEWTQFCACAHRPRYWRENMVVQGDNEVACLKGCAASLLHRSQEHGKANTEFISKTSKGGRSLPQKDQKQYKEMLAPVFLSPPPLSPPLFLCCFSSHSSLSTFYPLILSAVHSMKLPPPSRKMWNHLRQLSTLLFWLVPGLKAPGITSVLFRNSVVPPCQGTGAVLARKMHVHAHIHTHTVIMNEEKLSIWC